MNWSSNLFIELIARHCVYHFALKELREAILESENDEALQLLDIMIAGKRLRDIADLPLDLLA